MGSARERAAWIHLCSGDEGNRKEGQNGELSDRLAPGGHRALCFDEKSEFFLRPKLRNGGSTTE
jgi:hypothetical protein